jgi:hypothetical protein
MDGVARRYHALEEQRTPPVMRLGDRAERVFFVGSIPRVET